MRDEQIYFTAVKIVMIVKPGGKTLDPVVKPAGKNHDTVYVPRKLDSSTIRFYDLDLCGECAVYLLIYVISCEYALGSRLCSAQPQILVNVGHSIPYSILHCIVSRMAHTDLFVSIFQKLLHLFMDHLNEN